jgi:hypothetical protein
MFKKGRDDEVVGKTDWEACKNLDDKEVRGRFDEKDMVSRLRAAALTALRPVT